MNAVVTEQEQRREGLGSSDAAPAVGLSPWKTQFQLYLEKLGEAPTIDRERELSGALFIELGNAVEPVALSAFTRRTKFQVSDRQRRVVDPNWSRRWVRVDGLSSDGGLIEAKSVGFADPEEWGDELEDGAVPLHYLIQTQHGLACTELPHAWMPLIVSNRQFRLYRIKRDEELIQLLTKREREFWTRVEARDPPAVANLEDVRLRWPSDARGKELKADTSIASAVVSHRAAKAREKQAKAEVELLELAIKSYMAECSELVDVAGEPLVTWRQAKPSLVFDEDTFALKHPKLHAEFLQERPGSRRFLNKLKGECAHPYAVDWQRESDRMRGRYCPSCGENINIQPLEAKTA